MSLRGAGLRSLASSCLGLALASAAGAQTLTPDPGAWRPLSYADLQRPSAGTATYADIWTDKIEVNNRAYVARGDRRFAAGNAPATEAHYVVWSPARSAVLSILNTATGCTLKLVQPDVGATVKLCPIRIAVYQGVQVSTLDGGRACFLELTGAAASSRADPNLSVAYASYDLASRTMHTGLIVNHRAVDGCSMSIPVPRP